MSPLERLLLREHEERITSTRPVDLPMSEAARAARAALQRPASEPRVRAPRKPSTWVPDAEAIRAKNQRNAAYKLAWKAAKLAKAAAERRRVSLAALREGATWAEAARQLGVSVNSLAQSWIVEAEEPPEVTRARQEHMRMKRHARVARRLAAAVEVSR